MYDAYTEKLVREIGALSDALGKPFRTAFIGGGNPGCLGVANLERICYAVCAKGRPLEFTTEMNPESLSNDHFHLFDGMLTRLSMGVQSLDEKALSFLGRNSSLEQTIKGLELSQKLDAQLSYDLITCLPGWHDALKDVKSIFGNFPSNHLSVYALTLEESTPLGRMDPRLPDEDEQASILYSIWNWLEEKGYSHYEVSNFAKPGFESLHNSAYWDYMPYAGLGCAGASTAISSDGVTRFNGRLDLHEYIGSGEFQTYDEERLSRVEALEEMVIMGLRHKKGLDLARAKALGLEVKRVPDHYSVIDGFLVPDDEGLMTADSAALALFT